MRWACANRSEISTVIYQWTAAKTAESRAAENLSPEVKAKVDAYEVLENQLNRMRFSHSELTGPRTPAARPGQAPEEPTAVQKEYNELYKKVAEAKQPVAYIIDQRQRESTRLSQEYSVENVVAGYAKGKYDVVAESTLAGAACYIPPPGISWTSRKASSPTSRTNKNEPAAAAVSSLLRPRMFSVQRSMFDVPRGQRG